MKDGSASNVASFECALQSASDDLRVEGVIDLPNQNGPGKEIDDDGQIEPSLAGGDVGAGAETDCAKRSPKAGEAVKCRSRGVFLVRREGRP